MDGETNLPNTDPSGESECESSEESEINDLTDATVSNILEHHDTQDFSGIHDTQDISCDAHGKLVAICRVCSDRATGNYYGVAACRGCKVMCYILTIS